MRLNVATSSTTAIKVRGLIQQKQQCQKQIFHYIRPTSSVLSASLSSCASPKVVSNQNKYDAQNFLKSITIFSNLKSSKSFSTSSPFNNKTSQLGFADTPLGKPECASLLDGLDLYTVPAEDDDHPITVYGINSSDISSENNNERKIILLLHGRTWSSVPVYHLLGGPSHSKTHESRSTMEALYNAGLQPYALDFRGFGGTPPDEHNWVEPNRCVKDAQSVLSWIAARHGLRHHVEDEEDGQGRSYHEMPALLGWSQGGLVAQLLAQKSPHLISSLTLYGSIYDPQTRYPRPPLYGSSSALSSFSKADKTVVVNDYDSAVEDFTIEGSIPPEPAHEFAEAALKSDPVKVKWVSLHQFNNIDPARVEVPTLVVVGDQDPYAPLRVQGEIFSNLGRAVDRQWSILSGADHAAHLLDGRARFVKIVKSFVEI